MRHSRLHRLYVGFRVARSKQLLHLLHNLARFDQLTVDEPLHLLVAYSCARKVVVLLLSNRTGISQIAPESLHALNKILIQQQGVELALVLTRIHKHLVLKAVILGIRLRQNMINLIGLQLIDVQRLTRIHAFTALHEVENEPFIVKLSRIVRLNLSMHISVLLFKIGKRCLQSLITTCSSPTLVTGIFVTRHLDVYMRRRFPSNVCNLIHYSKRLVNTAPESRRTRHLVQRYATSLARTLKIALVYLRLKLK